MPSPGCSAPLHLTYRPAAALKPFERNARTHTKKQIRKIADSIKAFGFTNPVLLDREGTIVAGHGRVAAARLLGMEEVPTVELDQLTPAQVRAYVLADNRLAEDAGWDQEILRIELQHIVLDNEIDVSLTGFEVPEIDLILGAAEPPADPDDELPAESEEVVTRWGDLWLLGPHRLLCGDARAASSYDTLIAGRAADLVFTDPPYNVRIDGHASGNGRHHHPDFAMASGEMSEAEFTAFLQTVFAHLARSSKDGSVHYLAMDWRHMREMLTAGHAVYQALLNVCVWAKSNGGMGSFYRSQHELFFVFKKGLCTHRNNVQLGRFGRYRTNLWQYPGASSLSRSGEEGDLLAMHPTVKPVALVADALLDASARGEIVLDCFLGSGSTLLAAERTGRTCYGMELEPRYLDLAIRRWQQITGEPAIHAVTGQSFDELRAERSASESQEVAHA